VPHKSLREGDSGGNDQVILVRSDLTKPLRPLKRCLKALNRSVYVTGMEVDPSPSEVYESRMLLVVAEWKLSDAPLESVHGGERRVRFQLFDVEER
jgi:hypothetical protein